MFKPRNEETNFVNWCYKFDMIGKTKKSPHVCFECRIYNKRDRNGNDPVCYKCNQPMVYIGEKFRPPKQDDKKGWDQVFKIHTECKGKCVFFGYEYLAHYTLPGTDGILRKRDDGYYDQQMKKMITCKWLE